MILLGGFGRSARTRGWAVLDGLRSKELTNILCFLEDVTKWVDEGSPVDIIYLDFKKPLTKCHIKDYYLN